MIDFQRYIESIHGIGKKYSSYYASWVLAAYAFLEKETETALTEAEERIVSSHFKSTIEEWQVKQASAAIRLYRVFLKSFSTLKEMKSKPVKPQHWTNMEEKVIATIRVQHKSPRTEKTYLSWRGNGEISFCLIVLLFEGGCRQFSQNLKCKVFSIT